MLGYRVDEEDREVDMRNKVILNVGGIRHETYLSTLRNIPDTRLHSLTNNPTQLAEFDPNSGEFFFDRHPIVFAQILNYYRTGKLHCPNDVCGPVFEDELAFWGLEDASIEPCCWMNYKKHGEAQANLNSFDKIIEEAISEPDYSFQEDTELGLQSRNYRQLWRKYQSRIWINLEEPSSSMKAKIIAMTSMFLIVASVIVSCLETMEYFSRYKSTQYKAIRKIEIVCVIWFTLEFLARIMVCPSKRDFVKQIMNWLDLAAIVPFYLQLFLANSNINSIVTLRIIRLIRVFRILKISRHSYSLQILGHTLKSSSSELFLLGFFLSIGVVVFSSLMFYAESESSKTKFTSIPAGFWWAVVTMTTVGYGDFVPTGLPGRLVGTCCAICGVLTIALPIPVIVSNFSLYYSHAKARQKSVKKKRPLVIGAANALKVIEPFVGSKATDLRPSIFSEINGYPSPRLNGRKWPGLGLEMAGSSFESSEASPSISRRRLSQTTDRQSVWPHNTDQSQNPELRNKQHTIFELSEDVPAAHDERQCEEKCRKASDEQHCQGAYDNKGAERQSSEGYDKDVIDKPNFILPTIQVERNSSSSQRSESNTDEFDNISKSQDENEKKEPGRGQKRNKKKSKKRRRSANNTTAVDAPGLGSKAPPGRMGRRDSVFVVGFTATRWKAKVAKMRNSSKSSQRSSRKTGGELTPNQVNKTSYFDLLEASSAAASQRSSPHDALSIVTTNSDISTLTLSSGPISPNFQHESSPLHQQPEWPYARRSSCPALQSGISERSLSLDGKRTMFTGCKSDENTGRGSVTEVAFGTQDINTSKRSAKRNPRQDDMSVACEKGLALDSTLSKNIILKRDNSVSSGGSDPIRGGLDGRSSRSSSPLVRQRALLSIETQETSSEDEDEEPANQELPPVFANGRKTYTDLNDVQKERVVRLKVTPQEFITDRENELEVGVSANADQVLPVDAKKTGLAERRNARPLTFKFPLADERRDHLNLSKSNSKLNEKDLRHSPVSSTSVVRVAQRPAQNYTHHQLEAFETTCDGVERYRRPDECRVNLSDKKQVITKGVLFGTQNSTSSTATDEFHRSYDKFQNTCWNGDVDSGSISIFPRTLSESDPSSPSIPTMPVDNHVSLHQANSLSRSLGKRFESTTRRPRRNMIEKTDSGISSVQSSIDSASGLAEKEGYRKVLKTISEVGTCDGFNAENIQLNQFFENELSGREFSV